MARKKQLLEAKVIHVSDGDTLKAECSDGEVLVVRLCSIDTPEKAQHHGPEAQEALAKLVLNKKVKIEQSSRDRYGRVVGKVYRGRTFVNEVMVREGHAWAYRDYLNEPGFIQLEEKARQAGKGLWKQKKPLRVAPWDWRKRKKQRSQDKRDKEALIASLWRWVIGTGVAATVAAAGWLWYSGRLDGLLPF